MSLLTLFLLILMGGQSFSHFFLPFVRIFVCNVMWPVNIYHFNNILAQNNICRHDRVSNLVEIIILAGRSLIIKFVSWKLTPGNLCHECKLHSLPATACLGRDLSLFCATYANDML